MFGRAFAVGYFEREGTELYLSSPQALAKDTARLSPSTVHMLATKYQRPKNVNGGSLVSDASELILASLVSHHHGLECNGASGLDTFYGDGVVVRTVADVAGELFAVEVVDLHPQDPCLTKSKGPYLSTRPFFFGLKASGRWQFRAPIRDSPSTRFLRRWRRLRSVGP